MTSYKIKNPVIVSAADGVGTKIEISSKLRNYKTIGIDLVAMCINDLIVQGAKPLFFLDYIALGKVKNKQYKEIIAMVLKGENVIKKNRDLMGATNPKDAKEGTIRQKFAISIDKNSVHGSDSEENASKEISLFFS